MPAVESQLNLFSFSGKARVLHLTWLAFFLSFVVWFNHAPLLAAIREGLGLSEAQKALVITEGEIAALEAERRALEWVIRNKLAEREGGRQDDLPF